MDDVNIILTQFSNFCRRLFEGGNYDETEMEAEDSKKEMDYQKSYLKFIQKQKAIEKIC